MRPTILFLAVVLVGFVSCGDLPAAPAAPETWLTSYSKAMSQAKKQSKMMLILFQEAGQSELQDYLRSEVFGADDLRDKLADYVCLQLPVDAKIRHQGRQIVLLEHEAFADLRGAPGLAVLDFVHPEADYYGWVVSSVPVRAKEDLSAGQMGDLLDLPPGMPEARARKLAGRWAARRARQKLGPPLPWHDSYREATAQARREGKMLLILFCAKGDASRCDCLDDDVLVHPDVHAKLNDFVRLRVPLDVTIRQQGKDVKLIDHASLDEMLGRQGMAVIDFAHKDTEYYETVVSCFPMLSEEPYTAEKTLVILGLPPGTLTQRTLIYAVRVHPDHPASTNGRLHPDLVAEAQSHSCHQARIRLQGHHNWERRFHRINRRLSRGMTACEVCAESWPGEGLLQGAIECVRCWRLSSGHWRAVRGRHGCYGYDMQCGSNGVWYATGVFGTRR